MDAGALLNHAAAAAAAGALVGSVLFWIGMLLAGLALVVGVGLPALFFGLLAVRNRPPDPGDGRANAFGAVMEIAVLAVTVVLPVGLARAALGALVAFLGDGLALGPAGRPYAWLRRRSTAGRP